LKRFLGWFIGLPLTLVLLVLIYCGFKLVTYEQLEDEQHLQAKRDYLLALGELPETADQPNIVIILLDDLGYGDIGAYGARSIKTPHIDSLAEGGTLFSHYYSPSPVCSPSRAGLMTGRYPPRAGLGHVVFPERHPISQGMKIRDLNIRVPGDEIMLPEVLAARGYNTGMVGKWHMGDVAPSRPNDFGFDSYYGALYSNDMTPFALYRNLEIAEPAELDQTRLNELYTRELVSFVERQDRHTPFFLYYAHNFPHIPLYSSPAQSGKSNAGLYGDVVEDIDYSVGVLLETLRQQNLMENTLVIFSSDNGPWYQGNPGFTRGRKTQTWEGGQRVPFIVYWEGRVRAGAVDDAPLSGVDLFPTLLGLLGLPLPADRIIDGTDLSRPLMEGTPHPQRPIFYYSNTGTSLDAVRDERFKYHRRRGVRSIGVSENISALTEKGPWLFDLVDDAQESYDVSEKFPQDMQRLGDIFAKRNEEMAANLRGWITDRGR
jgi:arylsulfatase A-like enzyme